VAAKRICGGHVICSTPAGIMVRERKEARVRTQIERAFRALVLDRRALLCAGAGAAILLPSAAYAERAERVGSVEDVRGEAFAEARAQRRQLAQAAPLFINDLVGTGPASRLTLQLGKDTTLRVGSEARLTIDRLLVNAGGEITLQSGPILYDRPAAGAPARMRIRSSFGLIAVRGTRFFAGPSAGVFGVFVERGNVSVTAGGRQVLVRTGQGTNIAGRGAAPTPPAPWGPERVRTALESVR
jgi:FecR protein